MSKGDPLPPIPGDAPRAGEQYRHFKGGLYRVVNIALDSSDAWVVVYEPLYENPAAALFVRPVLEWNEEVEREGARLRRFVKVGPSGE